MNSYNKLYYKFLKNLEGFINDNTLKMRYHKKLPSALIPWYVYTLDGGHNIFVLLKQDEIGLKNDNRKSYEDFIIPCPVKKVLRGYAVNSDGIVIVDGIEYTEELGLLIDYEDVEYSIVENAR